MSPARARRSIVLAALAAGWIAWGGPAGADLSPEPIGRVATVPSPGPHWIWASDGVNRRIALVDLDAGEMRGVVDGGWGITAGLFGADGRIFIPETHYSRGSRGQRTDVVT
ncbi:MAG TPA: hypothetical protein VKB65_10480, partial [Myxococcota bacterium]|nr:hypothetical protein [Myxococcota bacterium]